MEINLYGYSRSVIPSTNTTLSSKSKSNLIPSKSFAKAYRNLHSPFSDKGSQFHHLLTPDNSSRKHSLSSIRYPPISSSPKNAQAASIQKIKELIDGAQLPINVSGRLLKYFSTGDSQALEYCSSCPHCKSKDNGIYKVKYYLKKSAQNSKELLCDTPDSIISKICSRKCGDINKQENAIVIKELELFNSLVENYVDRKLKLEELIDTVRR
jgi:hypothetical protein